MVVFTSASIYICTYIAYHESYILCHESWCYVDSGMFFWCAYGGGWTNPVMGDFIGRGFDIGDLGGRGRGGQNFILVIS